MILQELLKSGQAISITIGLPELEIFGKNLIQSAKLELEQAVISDKAPCRIVDLSHQFR